MSLHNKSLAELSRALHEGDVSSLELTQDFLSRIQANADLNAFITLCEPQALLQAQAADELRAKGHAGVLTGIPLAHKDIFCTQGIKSSCGSKMLDNFISPYNATLIEQFNQAGCVTLGKTNMDEFAMGSSNETSYYGKVKNPWDKTRVPGGSSGGSATAVAARLVPGATGTDTGGSIRQPAALTGITGLKPTYGRVSRYGMIAFASSLDQAGPLARSAEDCALMLQAMAGFDAKDSTSIDTPVPDYVKGLNKPLKGLKVGLPKEYFTTGLRSDIADGVQAAIDLLAKQGVQFVDISLPNQALSIPAYYVVAPAECSSNLSRYDGVRFGHRCDNPVDLEDLYKRSRGEGFGAEVKRRMMIGTYVLSAGYYDAYYLKAQQIRQLISKDFSLAFEQVDLILGPTIANTAFQFGAKSEDPIAMYMEDIYTCAANLAGLPGISVPCGLVDGLPIGLQIIGKAFAEVEVLNLAHQYQSLTAWHQECPAEYV